MGCCSSTASVPDRKRRIPPHSPGGSRFPRSDSGDGIAPPPAVEEETVKEVLSETPSLVRPRIPHSVPIASDPEDDDDGEQTGAIASPKPDFPFFKLEGQKKIEKRVAELKGGATVAAEISEASEICSLGESLSTATTNVTREDDDECVEHAPVFRSPKRLLPKSRSPSGEMVGGGRRDQRLAGKSPSRRSEQSPGRRNWNGNGSVRMVQAREQAGRSTSRRGSENLRRDSVELSARRSRSPAMARSDSTVARSGVGRIPSAKRSAKSPGRVNGAPAESDGTVVKDPKWPKKNSADESLENPMVSLECFIFL